jgi:hypothetical protein
VLNREAMGLDPKYRFYLYYNAGNRSRMIGGSGMLDIETGKIRVLSEVTFPPLGYVLMFSGEAPDPRLVDITHFSRSLYNDYRDVSLRLPVLPVYTQYPGDYRDGETVLREAEENRLAPPRGD